MFMDDKGDTAVPCFLQHTRPFSAVKSEDFADFKTLTLKISANAAASVLHTQFNVHAKFQGCICSGFQVMN